jgi:hypothetical protein
MSVRIGQIDTSADITDDVHLPEDGAPICMSLKSRAEGLEAIYKRKHAGFISPHCILTTECSLMSYWIEVDGKPCPTFSRAFTFLNEKDELVTFLFPLGLWEKRDLD